MKLMIYHEICFIILVQNSRNLYLLINYCFFLNHYYVYQVKIIFVKNLLFVYYLM